MDRQPTKRERLLFNRRVQRFAESAHDKFVKVVRGPTGDDGQTINDLLTAYATHPADPAAEGDHVLGHLMRMNAQASYGPATVGFDELDQDTGEWIGTDHDMFQFPAAILPEGWAPVDFPNLTFIS